MKEKFLTVLPYLIAIVIAVLVICCDVVMTNSTNVNDYDNYDYEEYAKSLVESSEVMLNGKVYSGVYTSEELTNIPEDYTYIGTLSEMVDDETELTNDLTSHVLPSGYDVYASASNPNTIYVKITDDSEETQSYIEYAVK